MNERHGKLPRLWARVCIVLAITCCGLLFYGTWTEQKWFTAGGILAAVLCVILRVTLLKCPHCGYRAAPPQWSKNGTLHCVKCGEPFEYDR